MIHGWLVGRITQRNSSRNMLLKMFSIEEVIGGGGGEVAGAIDFMVVVTKFHQKNQI